MSPRPPRKAIEEGFPIVEINRLAKPERNAFKPIYQMHKWFARRASCVFRAILLGAMKPAGADIMEEFYKDHSHDPDTNGVHILDPFMGGGTTIVEALRLGCRVTGIDLNPVAWFIVKSEVEPVDLDELKAAFERLAERPTASGKSLREDLLEQYKTECPCCGAGREEADTIYTFWVKSVTCTSPTCRQSVPLFGSYVISAKSPFVRYVPDFECASCKKTFDLEIDSVALVPEVSLMAYNARDGAGDKRGAKRWAVADFHNKTLVCPWCSTAAKPPSETNKLVIQKKKIALTVLLCPHCWAVWQYRGTLPEQVTCPVCAGTYNPLEGNIPTKGKFRCPTCGNPDSIINAIRKLAPDQLLQTVPYAIEGYCSKCAGKPENNGLFKEMNRGRKAPDHACNLFRNNGKFFKKITPGDLKRYQEAEARWERENESLPYPKGEIPVGEKTKSGLLAHHYRYWHQMFNPRQLLCLSTLLKGIDEENDQVLKEMLLSAFQMSLEANNMFARYRARSGGRSPFGGVFARHDFQPKLTPCEINVFGPYPYYGTFLACSGKVEKGKNFNQAPFDYITEDKQRKAYLSAETIIPTQSQTCLLARSSEKLLIEDPKANAVVTDPPYGGNVNYSELADFFYVWLRLVIGKTYPHFAPEITPKADEIIENPTRGKTAEDYKRGLASVWAKCHESLEEQGLLIFTFHHAEGSTWETLLDSLCQAGFAIEAIYPIHGESESSLHLMDKDSISYDLIHVCKKRDPQETIKERSWAGVRQEIRARAREEIKTIEAGRYGSERLSPADKNIILIGKCLELYSRHYGKIVDFKGDVVPLGAALLAIRMMVEQLVSYERPLPSELEVLDPVSYVYFTCLCDRKEITSDEVHKTTRGLIEPAALIKAGVMRKGRAKRGRTYEVKTPDERYRELDALFIKKGKQSEQLSLFPEIEEARFDQIGLVDVVHYLIALAQEGENLSPWLKRFEAIRPQLRAALEYLQDKNPTFLNPVRKIQQLMEF